MRASAWESFRIFMVAGQYSSGRSTADAMLPRLSSSSSGPAWSKFEKVADPFLQAATHSRSWLPDRGSLCGGPPASGKFFRQQLADGIVEIRQRYPLAAHDQKEGTR